MRCRIGIDARSYRRSTSGIGTYTRELLTRLLPLGRANDYIVYLTEDDQAEWNIVLPHVTTRLVPFPYFSPKEQTHLLKMLVADNLDLVHFLNFPHPIRYRGKFVVTLHDLTMFLFPSHTQKGSGLVRKVGFQLVFRHAMKKADKVIAISKNTASDASRLFKVPSDRLSVIYEGGPTVATGGERRLPDSIVGDDPFFIFISAWRSHKGLLTLIEAFEKFKHEGGHPHRLVLVGNARSAPPDILTALEHSSVKDQIVRTGFISDEDLSAMLGAADALIMPSEYEGFGLPVLEAFAAGTPVISARNSSLIEVGGEAALFFPTSDAEALADCLRQISNDPTRMESMRALGYRQLARFSWDTCAEQTLAVYGEVLGKS